MFIAHSEAGGQVDPIIDHLTLTGNLAKSFAARFAPAEAELAGLAHDLGKYGDLFQRRLRGEISHIDHWSAGAWIVLQRYRSLGLAPSLAIQGHHIGLQSATKANWSGLNPAKLAEYHPLNLRLSDNDLDLLESRYLADGGRFPTYPNGTPSRFVQDMQSQHDVAAMLDVRMLFSALVDADFLATEAHFERQPDGAPNLRKPGRSLSPEDALGLLQKYIGAVRESSHAQSLTRAMRDDLQRVCSQAGGWPRGLYTLTAPTGSGKTLAMLLFALEHAHRHGLSRVIVVLPFLNLIEQTASVYKRIFVDQRLGPYVVEDHSLSDRDDGETESDARLLAQNWDAPIIVTTSVNFLESLFANRPGACRKLHNIADSVVLFDEVQTLPVHLAIPTLAALSQLYRAFGCTIVLSTATQPAFESLSSAVSRHTPSGWFSTEIVSPELNLFSRQRRVTVHWPQNLSRTTFDQVAEKMLEHSQVLTIVNIKRHSRKLFELLIAYGIDDGLYHLSTDMCPAHRLSVLGQISDRLHDGLACRVSSTQCIEAGVDLDFPTVFRSWGPLEALAQAAGRCNRNGLLERGDFHVFLPPVEEEIYPGSVYKMAAAEVKKLIHEFDGTLNLQDPTLFNKYYRELYDLSDVAFENDEVSRSIKTLDFAEVTKQYRLIQGDTVNVLVPYGAQIETYRTLRDVALKHGLSRGWIRRARPLSISIYRTALRSHLGNWLEPIKYRGADTDWYIYLKEAHYSEALGLVAPEADEFLIG